MDKGKNSRPVPLTKQNTKDVGEFFSHWQRYQKISSANYLFQKESSAILQRFISDNFIWGFSIMDLGCGDTGAMSKILRESTIEKYTGVDLSPVALRLAENNLKKLHCEKNFICGDFLNYVQSPGLEADIVWLGFSLHHLPMHQKEKMLVFCRSILGFHGYVIIYEPLLKENESVENYLRRWWKICCTWKVLSDSEKEEARWHAMRDDHPESLSTLEKIGLASGFKYVERLYKSPNEHCHLVCFRT
ncbi:MAG TPA: hypothetical protein DET40_19585 [Lentisphaeria bacterium]|nr:MAG: hypothetical protein A2X45_18415 [Lentisphaerae bacterium GWF2_50_93]HCE45751.1 hypothetical protein [Lentisphaeria bacterium]